MSLRFLSLTGLLALTLSAQQTHNQVASAADKQFVMKAAHGGKTEVELGRMAAEKASSDAVKTYAQRLVTDHTRANEELATLASGKNIQIPAADTKDHKAVKEQARLSNLQGEAFDKAFIQHAIKDHQKDIALFEKQANSGSDPELKAFASKTLPSLREHLEQARSIASELGVRDHSQTSLDPSGQKARR